MNQIGLIARSYTDVRNNADISKPVFDQLTRHIRSVDFSCLELYKNYCPEGFKIISWGEGSGRIIETIKPNLRNQNGDGGLRSLRKYIGSINNLFIDVPNKIDRKKELIEKNLIAIKYNPSLNRNVLKISTDKRNGIFQSALNHESKLGVDSTYRFRMNVKKINSPVVFFQLREKFGGPILSLRYIGKRGLIATVPDNQGGYIHHHIGERNPRNICSEEWNSFKVKALWKDHPQIQVTVNKENVLDYISPRRTNSTEHFSQMGVFTSTDTNDNAVLLFDKINEHHRKLKSGYDRK